MNSAINAQDSMKKKIRYRKKEKKTVKAFTRSFEMLYRLKIRFQNNFCLVSKYIIYVVKQYGIVKNKEDGVKGVEDDIK